MTYYQVNTKYVAYENIENEVVIIHLDNGNYFNLEGVGADIWNAIVSGVSQTDIVNSLEKVYNTRNIINESVNNFINQLESEELIIQSSEIETNNQSQPELITKANRATQTNVFVPPSLQKYEDMQDLLLLDPLHDVNEAVGWPMRKS